MMKMPAPPMGSFAPYHGIYLSLVPPERHQAILESQVQELEELLASQDGDHRYAADKWSIKEVVGHISDTERIHAYRLLSIARGERRSLPGFEQNAFVAMGDFQLRPLAELLAEFRIVRLATLSLLQGLPPASLDRIGQANDKPMGVLALAYLIPGHTAHHLQVLRERYLRA